MKNTYNLMRIGVLIGLAASCAGCTGSRQQTASDLTYALDAAALAESVYAAQPSANPKTVAKLSSLLAAAQAAVTTWQASSKPGDQAIAAAAIAALVEYQNAAP
jgi:hypothetical protein